MRKIALTFLVTYFVLLALPKVAPGQAISDFKPVTNDRLNEKDSVALIKSMNQRVEGYHASLRESRLLDVKIKALSKRLSWLRRNDVRRDPANALANLKTKLFKTHIDAPNGIGTANRYAIRNSIESELLSLALVTDKHERNSLYHKYERERIGNNANRNS